MTRAFVFCRTPSSGGPWMMRLELSFLWLRTMPTHFLWEPPSTSHLSSKFQWVSKMSRQWYLYNILLEYIEYYVHFFVKSNLLSLYILFLYMYVCMWLVFCLFLYPNNSFAWFLVHVFSGLNSKRFKNYETITEELYVHCTFISI